MELTDDNISEFLDVSEPQLTPNLKQVFTRIADTYGEWGFLRKAIEALQLHLNSEHVSAALTKYGALGPWASSAVDAGLLEVMFFTLGMAPRERHLVEDVKVQYGAFAIITNLLLVAEMEQREIIVGDLLKLDIIGLCLRFLRHDHFCIRQRAVETLRLLITDCVMLEKISASQAADVFETICLVALEAPGLWSSNFTHFPSQCEHFSALDGAENDYEKASRVGAYAFAQTQEDAIKAVHALTLLNYREPQKFCLDMLKRRPIIVDLLLDCTIIDRSPALPHSGASTNAIEALCMLFQWPWFTVPGVPTPADQVMKAADMKSLSKALRTLTSRRQWAERVIKTFTHLEESDASMPRSWCNNLVKDYDPIEPPLEDAYEHIWFNRRRSHVYFLRLITTLTHFADPCGVTNAEIMSFLPIAYEASQKYQKTSEEEDEDTKRTQLGEQSNVAENHPYWVDRTDPSPLYKKIIRLSTSEETLAPALLLRLLAVLAQRNVLAGIQTLTQPPPGLSRTTSLEQIQQITNPNVIRRIISIAHARMDTSLEHGRSFAPKNRPPSTQAEARSAALLATMDDLVANLPRTEESACAAFVNAAELGAALDALDAHTRGLYTADVRGARRKLVVALGNAAQMALRLEKWRYAYSYALGAVTAAEKIPPEENLGADIMAKNKQRLNTAEAHLQLDGSS
ncbi:hypothetical protein CONPUDRAFT_157793 [Coniophora puteana RWD-64-598 SS2]|uniref:Uncharacterized protein n=1 Tax=Coniophora puteana (strain RWD-64-598) TaxID=741705 RepID=A0A5M3MBJ1_CONPW|nr:uncharacterized protein CONPUDRAFT_157793 [Coniophora puteana RWD-64-598 SS2]EIW76609.1 hypothetical protein CONPUDRAFT_157793 [Coniophora puteana RWD-64-598 SS2]